MTEDFPSIHIDPDMPEDEVRIVSGTSMVRMVNVGKPQAIDPSAIEKMPRGYFLGIDTAIGESKAVCLPDPEYVSPLMRRLGYTRNPATCGHYKKRMYLGTATWLCSDCGVKL